MRAGTGPHLHVADLIIANVQHFELFAFFQAVEAANVIVRQPQLLQMLQ